MKRYTTDTQKITKHPNHEGNDTRPSPAPFTAEETNAKTKLGDGDVSRSA